LVFRPSLLLPVLIYWPSLSTGIAGVPPALSAKRELNVVQIKLLHRLNVGLPPVATSPGSDLLA
jgi:hypothetical protein